MPYRTKTNFPPDTVNLLNNYIRDDDSFCSDHEHLLAMLFHVHPVQCQRPNLHRDQHVYPEDSKRWANLTLDADCLWIVRLGRIIRSIYCLLVLAV